LDFVLFPAFEVGAQVGDEIAAVEEEAGHGVLGTGAEQGLPGVEEHGGGFGSELALESGGGSSSGPPGLGAESAQNGQAGGLAGFFDRGVDVEVGSEKNVGAGVGVEDPEGEDGALGLGTDQVVGDGCFEIGEELVIATSARL